MVLGAVPDRFALALLIFVTVLEAINVAVAMTQNRPTLPAVDLLFTTTGGAVLTESLTRRHKAHRDHNDKAG